MNLITQCTFLLILLSFICPYPWTLRKNQEGTQTKVNVGIGYTSLIKNSLGYQIPEEELGDRNYCLWHRESERGQSVLSAIISYEALLPLCRQKLCFLQKVLTEDITGNQWIWHKWMQATPLCIHKIDKQAPFKNRVIYTELLRDTKMFGDQNPFQRHRFLIL